MKYIITDQDEVRVGANTFHQILAKDCKGIVIRAGECKMNEDGTFKVWGESYGYGITSIPMDALYLEQYFSEHKQDIITVGLI